MPLPPNAPTRMIAVVLALVATLALAACGGDGDSSAPDDATTTSTSVDGRDTTTTSRAGTAPQEIAAVLGDGTLVVLDAESGDVERTLLRDIDVDDPAKNGISLVPDGSAVIVVRPRQGQDEDHDLVRVPLDGAEPEVVANGRAPSVSPDGTTLAYVDLTQDDDEVLPTPAIVLRDLATGEERRLVRERERQFPFIVETQWTADGAQLAFIAGEIKTALYLVDADATNLDGARFVGPEASDEDVAWRAVAPVGDGRLAVVETCCDVGSKERWKVLAVEIESGAVEGGLLPEERVEAARLDADRSSRHLLVVTTGGVPGGGDLLRWSAPQDGDGESGRGSGELQRVRDGVVVAAW